MFVLVTYDISNDRRLRKAAAVMVKYGVRVQYSVYECNLSNEQFDEMICAMKLIINRREDKLYCYPLQECCRYKVSACGYDNNKKGMGFYIY